MEIASPFICPYCLHAVTLTEAILHQHEFQIDDRTSEYHNYKGIANFVICPLPTCRKMTIEFDLEKFSTKGRGITWENVNSWRIIPKTKAKTLPEYIPKVIREDYEEAYLILNDSPKASATLSRRCLQGMIRDFHGVSKYRLVDEIAAIKDKIDSQVWDAIDALRQLGNIGAHMEKDINIITDVDAGEAELLIGLIELLMKEWYINRFERDQRLKSIIDIAKEKKEMKKPPIEEA